MKKIFTLAFFIISSTFLSQIPTAGLIGGWPFTGNANDMSGSGNHGTVTGAILTTDRFGTPNCAYSFNGINNYITMLAAGPTGTVSRSVSFWERTTYTSAVTSGFSYGSPGGIFQVNFNYNCQAVGFDNSNSAVMHGNNIINNNQWHHIVAVMNSSVGILTGNVLIYIDGVQQPAITCAVSGTSSVINSNASLPIKVGLDVPSGSRYFKGDLDDFYFYNRAITPAEVLLLYNYSPCAGAPGDPSGIAGATLVCTSATNIYSVAPVSGATSYSWTLPGGWTGSSTTNTISVTAGINSGFMTVSAINTCGSSQPVMINVNVNPSPTVSIIASNPVICNGNNTNLFGSGATSYTWNTSSNSSSITIFPSVTTSYTLSGSNSFGCVNSSVITITVTNNPLPTISVSGPSLMCTGQTINLASNGASTYTWQPGGMNGFLVSVSPSVTTNYTVTGTDANGCYNSTVYTQSVSTCAGISQITQTKTLLNIYPNPFSTSVVITSNLDLTSAVEVYNTLGSLIYKTVSQGRIEINLTDKDAGIYFVRVLNEYGIATEKLVKYQ